MGIPLEPVSDSTAEAKRRILIVDDDPNNTHLVKILLERCGPYLVLEENYDAHAYQAARSFKPDLVLLDVVMQGLDGGIVAQQIQADGALHDTPIIFLTGLVTKAEAKSGLHIDGHPVVAKPINIPELIEAIENTIACAFTPLVAVTAPHDPAKREILATSEHRRSQSAATEIA